MIVFGISHFPIRDFYTSGYLFPIFEFIFKHLAMVSATYAYDTFKSTFTVYSLTLLLDRLESFFAFFNILKGPVNGTIDVVF